jgi:glycosyltransferase involved in cell wall biosynthesis
MLSILIPVYNYDCTELVRELAHSCTLAKVPYEIILGNDCSSAAATLQSLAQLEQLDCCRVLHKEHNIGRAFILNEMSSLARFPFLLIIDSDARLASDNFIETYVHAATSHDVVCGGIVVRESDRSADNLLRYRYEHAATKSRALAYRLKHPYEKFSTFNLLIRKAVFSTIRFDSHCSQYGYEDTVLGLDLMRNNIPVLHINNPLVHTGIDSNESFIAKTNQSLEVLANLDSFYQRHIRLSRVALSLQRRHLLWLPVLWHKIFGGVERRLLMRCPGVFLFWLYKLGRFSCLLHRRPTLK